MLEAVNETGPVRGAALLLACCLLGYHLVSRFLTYKSFDAPLEGAKARGGSSNAGAVNTFKLITSNYEKYRDRFFKIPESHGETVILPRKYIEELKALPQDVLAFEEALSDRFLGEYTDMKSDAFGIHGRTFPKSINQNLTRNLNSLMKDLHEECRYAFDAEIGSCEDWTEVNIFAKLVDIVALVSGRIFIGPEMNRDKEYMRCIIQYTMEVFVAIGALQQKHPLLRGLYARMGWIPELNKIKASQKSMEKIIGPVVAQRLEQLAAGEELPSDLVTWNMANSEPKIKKSVPAQAHLQLVGSMAAIHTTSMTGSHVLYDLAARPEYAQPLREELEKVMSQEREGYLSKTSTPKLKLLDSFCKESQRLNPLGQITFNRKVKKTITLHDGTVLPPGTVLAVPSGPIATDEKIFPNSSTFDPWRFAKLREERGHETRHQFVTTSPESLNFGYGNHACPGRFFANNELKIIFTYVLANYDIKMPEGEGRPGNIITSGGARPDTTKVLLMRKRAAA